MEIPCTTHHEMSGARFGALQWTTKLENLVNWVRESYVVVLTFV